MMGSESISSRPKLQDVGTLRLAGCAGQPACVPIRFVVHDRQACPELARAHSGGIDARGWGTGDASMATRRTAGRSGWSLCS